MDLKTITITSTKIWTVAYVCFGLSLKFGGFSMVSTSWHVSHGILDRVTNDQTWLQMDLWLRLPEGSRYPNSFGYKAINHKSTWWQCVDPKKTAAFPGSHLRSIYEVGTLFLAPNWPYQEPLACSKSQAMPGKKEYYLKSLTASSIFSNLKHLVICSHMSYQHASSLVVFH